MNITDNRFPGLISTCEDTLKRTTTNTELTLEALPKQNEKRLLKFPHEIASLCINSEHDSHHQMRQDIPIN